MRTLVTICQTSLLGRGSDLGDVERIGWPNEICGGAVSRGPGNIRVVVTNLRRGGLPVLVLNYLAKG